MPAKVKHYVEFMYPGILFSESSSQVIGSRNVEYVVIELLPKMEGCFAFRFYDMKETKSGSHKLTSEPFKYSGTYYINGKEYTLAQVKKQFADQKILISNMEINKYPVVIRTIHNQFMPKQKKDTVLEVKKLPSKSK